MNRLSKDEARLCDSITALLQRNNRPIQHYQIDHIQGYVLLHYGMICEGKQYLGLSTVYRLLKKRLNATLNFWLSQQQKQSSTTLCLCVNLDKRRRYLRESLLVRYMWDVVKYKEYGIHCFYWATGVGPEIPMLDVILRNDRELYTEMQTYAQNNEE